MMNMTSISVDGQLRCRGCFDRLALSSVCGTCHFDPESQNSRYPIALAPGTVLDGKYLLGRVLGHGAFGITYLCFDTFLNTRVAVKEYYPPEWLTRNESNQFIQVRSDHEEAFARGLGYFFKEAQILATLDHWNILRVRAGFKAMGTAFMVTDYYQGCTLEEYVQRHGGRLSETQALDIFRPLLFGLEKVHQAGIVHRDIKPTNIYVTQSGRSVLLDFGAARIAEEENSNYSVVGTPGYMPLEQFEGEDLGPWSDIYACGVVLFKLLTGEMPPNSIARLGRTNVPPKPMLSPRDLNSRISPQVDHAILSALELQSYERPQTVAALLELLGTPVGTARPLLSPSDLESLAHRIHEHYVLNQQQRGESRLTNPAVVPWAELPEKLRESNREQARHIQAKLALIGCEVVPQQRFSRLFRRSDSQFSLSVAEVEYLAEREHERWYSERKCAGWEYAPVKDVARRHSPYMLPWDELQESIRDLDREPVRAIPAMLQDVGYRVVRP